MMVAEAAANEEDVTGQVEEPEEDALRKELAVLREKCGRLEAQNILVAVQQLDWIARGISMALSALCLSLYWRAVWYLFAHTMENYDRVASSASIVSALLFVWEAPMLLLDELLPNPYGVWVDRWFHVLFPTALKVALLLYPIFHHRRTHGLGYRRFQVFAVFFIVLLRMKLCRWREHMFAVDTPSSADRAVRSSSDDVQTYGSNITEDDIWEANYEVSARFLYVSILRLRGLWTKSAQYLSSRADFMTAAYVRELQKLQDSAPQTPWNEVVAVIPQYVLDELTDLEETAIASASIGQVHAARLRKTGERVCVKVQHPFARTLLLDDFRSLHIFCRIVRLLEPEYGFLEQLMREWSTEACKELDFLQEMQNLNDAGDSIEELMNGKSVLQTGGAAPVRFQVEIPRPFQSLCTREVLVMSFCEGSRIDDVEKLKEWNLPAAAVMDGVTQAFAHMMYVAAPFNGDPHSGNLFVRPGTNESQEGFTLVLLDWGLAKRLSGEKQLAFCQMAYAAATFDFGLLLDAFNTIGLKMKRENVAEDMEGIRFLLRDVVPKNISRKRIKAKINTDQVRV
jgi:predicted unusual protein kinase regulating ubiquinone biosynthesis (AarF/ABC1/UbiB family)